MAAFSSGVATIGGVPQAAVEVTEVQTVDDINALPPSKIGRRLLQAGGGAAPYVPEAGVRVSFTVVRADPTAFNTALSYAVASGDLETALREAGLASLTSVGSVAVTPVPAPPEGPAAQPSAVTPVASKSPDTRKKTVGAIVGGVIGGTAGLCISVAVVSYAVKRFCGRAISCVDVSTKKSGKDADGAKKKRKKKRSAKLPKVTTVEVGRSEHSSGSRKSGGLRGGEGKFTPSKLPVLAPSTPQPPKRTLSGELLSREGRILVQKWADSPINFQSPKTQQQQRDGSGRSFASTAFGGSPAHLAGDPGAAAPAAAKAVTPRRSLFSGEPEGDFNARMDGVLQAIADAPPTAMYDPKTGLPLKEGQQAAGGRLAAPQGSNWLAFTGQHLGTGTAPAGEGAGASNLRPPTGGAVAAKKVVIAHAGGPAVVVAGAAAEEESSDESGSEYTGSSGEEEEEDELDEEASVGSPAGKAPAQR